MELVYSVVGISKYEGVYFSYKNSDEEVECVGKDQDFIDILSSHFYKVCKEKVKGKPVKLTYFISQSIKERAEEELSKNIDKEDWHKVLIPSFGYDTFEEEIFKYEAHYPYLNLIFLLNILKDMLDNKESLKAVKVDISVGWNFYVSALIEALRTASVFWKLYNFTNTNMPKFSMIFSDPITTKLSEKKVEFFIYEEELKVKVWFDIPLKSIDKKNSENLQKADIDRNGIELLERAILTFNAIRQNAPLVIYTFGYDEGKKVDEFLKNYILEILEKYKPEKAYIGKGHYKMPSRETIETIKSVILTLALYRNIAYMLEKYKIPQEGRKWVDLEDLKRSFITEKGLYERYGLLANKIMLERDIENFEEKLKNMLKEGKEKNIEELETGRRTGCYVSKYDKRNFLAHSGFERKITMLKKQDGKLYIGYCDFKEGGKKIIEDFLK